MAVRFDASADAYLITTGLPTSSTFTFCAWLRIAVDRNDYSEIISFGATYMSVATNIDGTSVGMWDAGSYNATPLGSTAFTVGTWYRVAGVVSGTNVTFYRGAAGAALTSTSAANYTSGTPTSLRLGDYWDSGGFMFNGNMAAFKLWNAALSAAEVEQELTRYTPVRTANLLRFHPFLVPETTDYSGNGYSMTAGTATREDGPPLPWQASTPRLVRPAPAGGGPVSGTATAPLGALAATTSGLSTVSGAATAPLGSLTATAAGTPTVHGVAAAGFGSLAASAAGAQIEPGTATAPLGGLAATAAGVVTVAAAASAALGSLTASASGIPTVPGTAAALLGALTATAAGTVTGSGGGTAEAVLGSLTAGASGGVAVTATAAATLGALAASTAGVPTVFGVASVVLGELLAQAAGQGQTVGGAAPLGALTASAAGVRAVAAAAAAAVLGGMTAVASGATFASGTAVALLGALAATATVAPPVTKGSMTSHTRPGPTLTTTSRQPPTLTGHTRPGPTMTEVT